MPTKVLMLTNDLDVDRRIIQQRDALVQHGYLVNILAGNQADISRDDPFIHRIRHKNSSSQRSSLIANFKRKLDPFMNNHLFFKKITRYIALKTCVNLEKIFIDLYYNDALTFIPDIVVAHDLPMLPVASKISSATNAKLVYDSHELYPEQEFSSYEKKVWRKIERKYIDHCNLVMTINPSAADHIKNTYKLAQVGVISNSFSLAAKKSSSPKLFNKIFGLEDNAKILLYQGGLTPNRNLEYLVKAMALIKTENTHLIIMGKGALKEKLLRLVKTLNLQSKVHFQDHVASEDLISYTSSADLGIIPYQATSLNNKICTPNKLFEYIAANIPILATDLIEIKRIIEKYALGFTGSLNTPANIAASIDHALSDEKQLSRFKENTQIAEIDLSWQTEVQKFISLYDDIPRDR